MDLEEVIFSPKRIVLACLCQRSILENRFLHRSEAEGLNHVPPIPHFNPGTFTFQNCNICINTGMSNMLMRPLMLTSLNMIRLLQSSRLGFSARYARQCARNIFCSCVTSSSGGYLIMSLDNSGFPSG